MQVSLQLSTSEAVQEARTEAAASTSAAEAVAEEDMLEELEAEAAGSSHAAVVEVEAQGLREAGADAASTIKASASTAGTPAIEDADSQPAETGVGVLPAPAAAEQLEAEAEVVEADGSGEEASPDSSERRTPRPWAVPERQAAPAPSWVLQVCLLLPVGLVLKDLHPFINTCAISDNSFMLPVSLLCEGMQPQCFCPIAEQPGASAARVCGDSSSSGRAGAAACCRAAAGRPFPVGRSAGPNPCDVGAFWPAE